MWKYIKAGLIIMVAVVVVAGALWGLSKLSSVQNLVGDDMTHSDGYGEGGGGFGPGQGRGLGRGGGNGGLPEHEDLENRPDGAPLAPVIEHRGEGQTGSLSSLFAGTSVNFLKILLIVALIAIPWAIIDQVRKKQSAAAVVPAASNEQPAIPPDTIGTK